MRRVFWLLAASAIVVALAWWLAGLPGRVSATFGTTTIETATPIAVLAVAVLVLLFELLLRALHGLVTLPRRWRGWRARRRRAAGDQAVTRALVALAAGEAGDARHQAQLGRRYLSDTPQTLLLAAEAARLADNDAEAEAIYQILAGREDAAFLGLRGLFRQAMAREDWEAAARLAGRAEAVHPGATWLRGERSLLAVRTGNWSQALALAGKDGPRVAYATAAAEAEPDPERALSLARRAWKDNSGFTPAALAYARRLRDSGRESRALAVIRTAWKSSPHPDLAAFAMASVTAPLARVKAAEQLAAAAPDHAESHLLLARASLAAGLPGEARHHAEAARRAGMNQKRLWLLIAALEQAEHGDDRDALQHAAAAEPDPGWRCEACGTPADRWLPACPVCHTPGRVVWAGPARLALPGG